MLSLIIAAIGVGQKIARSYLTCNHFRVFLALSWNSLSVYSQLSKRMLSYELFSCKQTNYSTANHSCLFNTRKHVSSLLFMRKLKAMCEFECFDGAAWSQRNPCTSMTIVVYNILAIYPLGFEQVAALTKRSHLCIYSCRFFIQKVWHPQL